MAGKYAVPEEIRAMRPVGTTVKRQGDGYYVYETKSTSVKVVDEDGNARWKTKTKSGPCIGKIVPGEGFVPNRERTFEGEITAFQYGAFQLALSRSARTLERLQAVFDKRDAVRIYCLACLFVVLRMQGTRDISRRFCASVLSLMWPSARMDKDSVSRLYEDLGERAGRQTAFQQSLIDSSSHTVALDCHAVPCATLKRNPLSAWEYKRQKLASPQLNLVTAYDVEEGGPLCSEMMNGNEIDCSVLEALFGRFAFSDTLFIASRGFNTEADKALMTSDGNSYIVEMVPSRDDYQGVYDRFEVDHRQFFVSDGKGGATVIYYGVFDEDGVRRACFVDSLMADAERATYAHNFARGKEGYTEEGLAASEKDFGLLILECSDPTMSAREIFDAHQAAWNFETFYDYVKRELDFDAFCQKDYVKTQGLAFVFHVASMIYSEVVLSLEGTDVSLSEAMDTLSDVMFVRNRGGLSMRNETKEVRELSKRIGLDLGEGIKRVAEIEAANASLAGIR